MEGTLCKRCWEGIREKVPLEIGSTVLIDQRYKSVILNYKACENGHVRAGLTTIMEGVRLDTDYIELTDWVD